MASTIALSDARAELVYLAAIDGKTGSNGRHGATRINALLNRHYRKLLSRAGQLGLPHGLQNATGTLGAAATGEDYINVTIPAAAAEVVGVDVKRDSCFEKLDPLNFEQRRDKLCPPHGVGFWTVRIGPVVSGATLTQGALAVWPTRLSGADYVLHYVQQWTDISSDTHVFLIHDGWDEWFLNSAAMAVTQRDTNKRGNYDTAREAWLAADALLVAQAARLNRAGYGEPSPYLGIQL